MKSKIFLLITSTLIAFGMNAQEDTGKANSASTESAPCNEDVNIYVPSVKAGNFRDAYPFWKKVYETCPDGYLSTYAYGVSILEWLISEETDEAKKDELIEELMKLYDKRLQYFGDNQRYGKDWIIAQKAMKYNLHKGEKTDYTVIYQWLGEIINEFGEKVYQPSISLYMFASFNILQSDIEQYKARYVEDYLKCSALIEAQIAATTDPKDKENGMAYKAEIEKTFSFSGAADCEILQSIYGPKIEANKDNIDFLKETLSLLHRMDCQESDAYFAASEYAHVIAPTPESAQGLGHKAYKEKDNETAERYYNQAIELTDDPDMKGILYYNLAIMAFNQNNWIKAKQLSLKCLAEKPNHGNAYILIGKTYVQNASNYVTDDPVLSQCVYIAAVDKFERARQVDQSVADEARKLINTYSPYFPSSGDIFMHPGIKEGENYSIGGWIGETVKVRPAK